VTEEKKPSPEKKKPSPDGPAPDPKKKPKQDAPSEERHDTGTVDGGMHYG
jgi:hypothetical protein